MKRFFLIGIMTVCILAGAAAMEVEEPLFRGGLLFLGTADDDIGAPSPLLTSVGVSLPLRFSEHLLLEPALQFHGTWYGLSSDRPVAVPMEYLDKAWVLAVLIDPAFCARMSLGEKVTGGVSVSPALNLRFPTVVYQEATFDRSAALSHFFAAGRWFYPKAGLYVSWKATENITLRVQADAWFPVYHLWDGGAEPFWDDLMICGWIGFSFQRPAK